MVVHDQADLDAHFSCMDHLLALERPDPVRSSGACVGCGGVLFVYNGPCIGHPGSRVCSACGVVEERVVFWETMFGRCVPTKCSNYKRIHHWHERISQLLLLESQIPGDQMLQIAQKLCDGTYEVINKDSIRAVLRSLNLQLYIEKWLQIIYRITGIAPPAPGPLLLRQLDSLFLELQRPFNACRAQGRKNFLNYNYVFCRFLQKLDCNRFCMFFPLIKSKPKLAALDTMWLDMVGSIGWPATALQPVEPFAVRLQQPAPLLERLALQCALPAPVVIERVPWKKVYRKSDHRRAESPPQSPTRRHSGQPVPAFQKLGSLRRRLR